MRAMAEGDAALTCEESPGQEERPYKCKQCSRSYRHAGSLVNHQRTHEVGRFPCLVCHKDFSNPMALKSHLRTHLDEKRYKCHDCGRSFRASAQLTSHRCVARVNRDQEEEEGSNGGSYTVQKVQDTSSSSDPDTYSRLGKSRGNLLTNLEKYIAESVVPADFSQLQFPMKTKAEEEELLPAHQGEEDEVEEEEGEAGLRVTVDDERRYKCDQCDKAYKHAGSLTNHKQSHALGMYQCAMCHKAFSNLMALKSHTRLHSEYRPYKCRFCHKAFRLPSELLSHQKSHSQDDGQTPDLHPWEGSEHGVWEEDSIETLAKLDIYQPPPTGTYFGESAPCSLKDGSKAGGGERCNPDGELCVRCGGTFADEEDLKGHSCLYPEEGEGEEEGNTLSQPTPGSNGAWEERLKGGESYRSCEERPFHCEDCGRTYRHAGSLINHKKTHQIGVYSCTVCSKQLYNLAALKNHLRVHLKSKLGMSPSEEAPQLLPAVSDSQREAGNPRADGGYPMRAVDICRGASCPKEEEERAIEDEEQQRPYRCGDCGRSYRHRGSLVNHRHTHQTGIFQCSICPKQYSNLMALRNHVRVHLRAARMRGREQGGGLTCNSCGESFEEEAEFQLHQLRHVSYTENAEVAPVPKLSVFHSQEADLLQVIKQDVEALENGAVVVEEILPVSELTHACHQCGMTFANAASLQTHALQHSAESEQTDGTDERTESPLSIQRLYGCDQCGKAYRHSGSLINHKQTHQIGDFSCSICSKHFQNVASLKSHLRGHQKPKRGQAETVVIMDQDEDAEVEDEAAMPGSLPLGDEFQNSNNLLEEGAATNGCQVESPVPSPLQGETEMHPCFCDQCGLEFDNANSLMIHNQTHQLGIYQCSLCPKEYPSLLALKSHFRGHAKAAVSTWGNPGVEDNAEEQPFLCSLCGMIFPSEDGLQQHHSLTHEEEDDDDEEFQEDGQEVELKEEAEEHLDDTEGREEEELLSHICGYCGQTFDDMVSLEEHSEGHLEEKAAALADTSIQLRRAPRPEEDQPPPPPLPPPPPPPPPVESSCHIIESLDNRPYACGQCGKTYRHGGSLVNHKKIHQIGDYQCVVCCRLYPNMSAYRNHLRNHPGCKLNGSVPELRQSAADGGVEPSFVCEMPGKESFDGSSMAGEAKQASSCIPSLGSPVVEERSEGRQELSASPCEPRKIQLFDICGEMYEGKTVLEGQRPLRVTEVEDKVENEEEDDQEEIIVGEENSPGAEEEGFPLERPFQCDLCGRSYKHAGSLINHKQTHKTGLFYCNVCQKQFYNLMALKNHNRTHFETKRYRCPECPKAFRLQKQLASHQRVHRDRKWGASSQASRRSAQARRVGKMESSAHPPKHPLDPEERPYQCGECDRTYRHAGSLLNHRKSHKIGHFTCALCSKAYPNLMSLKNHQRIHYEVKRHQCPDCGKAFKWQRQLLRHQRRPHPCRSSIPGQEPGGSKEASGMEEGGSSLGVPLNSFQCQVCFQCFPSPVALKSHSCVHAKKGFACSECGKACRTVKDLTRHRRRHQGEAVVDIGKGGDSSPSPTGASKKSDERPYKCNSCERTYRHAGSLLNHKQVHATGLYRCPMCQKEFQNRLALKNHLHLHKNKRRHWCSRCGKHFRTSKRLANHAKVHAEQKVEGTLTCTVCSKRFFHQISFRQHQLSHAKETGHCEAGTPRTTS